MKRPLVTVAAGFVLGEVLALQCEQAAASGVPAGLVWVLVLILWMVSALAAGAAGAECPGLCGVWKRRAPKSGADGFRDRQNCGTGKAWRTGRVWEVRNRGMQGRGVGTRALLLFFVLALGGGLAGYGRSVQVKAALDRNEQRAGEFAGSRVRAEGTISRVEHKADSVSVVLEGVMVQAGRRTETLDRVMVYVDQAGAVNGGGTVGEGSDKGIASGLAVGMEAEVRGELDIMEGPRNPGEFDFRGYYRSKGIVCRMFGEKVEIVGGERVPYYNGLNRFRLWCSGVLDRICLPEDSPVFKAVLLGDTSWLEPEIRSMYQRNGISHLLAVSGQHLAIIGGGLYLILRRLGLRFKMAGAAAGVMVVSYGILTGSSGSAMRAVVMILCLWLAGGMGRSYDTLSALGLAALVLLFGQPYLLFQSGFQLSFGAVLAIGGLGSWVIRTWGIEKGWQKTLVISVSVQMVLTPVVLYHFYLHPMYGIVLNLLVIPLISVLMYSGILGIVLGGVWTQGGVAAVGAGHYIMGFYEWLCGLVERLPGYSLVMGRPEWWQMAVYGIGLMGLLYGGLLWMRQGKDGEGAVGCMGAFRGVCLSACSYGVCFLLLLPLPAGGLEVVCLDVGQGDGVVMETEAGVVLVDGGSSSEKSLGDKTLEPFLKSRGIGAVEYGIVSHGDSDHISGLVYLLEESQDVKIKNLILPAPGRGQEVYEELERKAERKGTRVGYMKPGDTLAVGELEISCMFAGGASAAGIEDRNAHSLVLCADYKNFSMLFTGDMGAAQEQDLLSGTREAGGIQEVHLSHAAVLKTAHHGSAGSSSQAFLEYVSPRLGVISYGRGNSYGHPSLQVLERFEGLGIPVMGTGIGGAVMLKTDGRKLGVEYFLREPGRGGGG